MSVVVVSTGGTIASTPESSGDAAPRLGGEDLVAAVPGLAGVAEVVTRQFSNVPSTFLTLPDLADLADLLAELDADPVVDGVVVTQGTDVLEESAYFLDLCYDGGTPVVVTGAMRNPSLPGADGPANLLASVRTCLDGRAGSAGVLVAFNDRVHAAREVTKANTMNVDAFRSPEFGPLAVVEEDRVVWRRRPTVERGTFSPDPDALTADVVALTATLDMPAAHVRAAREAEALCLATTGAGHVPRSIVPALESLRADGVPVVAASRCPEGRLARGTYGFEGSEATLRDLGCYYSESNLQKTRIGTIVALAADGLDAAFERP